MAKETQNEQTEQEKQLDNIKNKIVNLLKRAQHENTSKEEAASASAMAVRLATKYNLDLAQAAGWEKGHYDKLYLELGRQRWYLSLLDAICEYCFCSAYYQAGPGVHFIVGELHNRELVGLMIKSLIPVINKMADEAYHEAQDGQIIKIHKKTWKREYFAGAIHAIRARLRRQQKEMTEYNERQETDTQDAGVDVSQSDVPAYRALLVIKQNQLEEACKELVPNVKTARKQQFKWVSNGWNYGIRDGKNVALTDRMQIGAAQ